MNAENKAWRRIDIVKGNTIVRIEDRTRSSTNVKTVRSSSPVNDHALDKTENECCPSYPPVSDQCTRASVHSLWEIIVIGHKARGIATGSLENQMTLHTSEQPLMSLIRFANWLTFFVFHFPSRLTLNLRRRKKITFMYTRVTVTLSLYICSEISPIVFVKTVNAIIYFLYFWMEGFILWAMNRRHVSYGRPFFRSSRLDI